jgi:hypothetical protein
MTTLYVIGDSFSVGTELADHLYSSWPYHKNPVHDVDEYIRWEEIKKNLNHFNCGMEELKRAYPARVGELLGYEVINASRGNTGLEYFKFKVITDMLVYKKIGKTIVCAVIQFTNIHRHTFLKYQGGKIACDNYSLHSTKTDPFIAEFYKTKFVLEDEHGSFFKFMMDLYFIKSLLIQMGAKKVLLVKATNGDILPDSLSNLSIETLNLMDELNFDINTLINLEHFKVDKLLGGHFCEKTHQKFAEYLSKELYVS